MAGDPSILKNPLYRAVKERAQYRGEDSFCKILQFFYVKDGHQAPGQLYHPHILEISQSTCDHFPVGAQMVGNHLMGDSQFAVFSIKDSCSKKAATRLSILFHINCSTRSITSVKRLAISSLV